MDTLTHGNARLVHGTTSLGEGYHSDQTGSVSDGSRIFLERRVTAVAIGRTF